ncbi:hypothetical protein JCM8202_001993 [Rhodotorula sphaerocarpa]
MGNSASKDKKASKKAAAAAQKGGNGNSGGAPSQAVGGGGAGAAAPGGGGQQDPGPPPAAGSPAGTQASGSGGAGTQNGAGDGSAAAGSADPNGGPLAPSRSRSSTTASANQLSRVPTGSSAAQQNVASSASSTSGNNNNRSLPPAGDVPPTQTILSNPIGTPSSSLTPTASTTPVASSSAGGPSGPIGVLSTSPTSAPGPGGHGMNGAGAGSSRQQTFDIDDMISRLLDAGYSGKVTKSVCLKNAEITAICQAAREVFLSQPTLIELSPPVKIVGDVHGQYSDLIRLFEMCGFPPSANYLFLGDYVDRGKQSLETILLLLCYKVKYPENFFLLRGNHECANVTRVYGFYDECKRRCNIKIWKTFVDVFNCLPIAAVVASKIFCVHGGLSPSLSSMDDIRRISRPTDVPDYGLLNDLLWSDPSDTALDWEDNERGVSYCFGKSVIGAFLARYDFDLICRAHMVVEDGYEFWNERTLVTIFSAPNYCGEFDNFGSVMSVSEDLLCAFELLKPLDTAQLKRELAKTRRRLSSSSSNASTPV